MAVLSYAADIQPLFRPKDIETMRPMGVDLSRYESVKKNSAKIYQKLSAGRMPCDGAWSAAHLKAFKDWMDGGLKP